jgi:hypothetical protein
MVIGWYTWMTVPSGKLPASARSTRSGLARSLTSGRPPPEPAARYYARPGITYRPVTGVSPSQVGVAWPPARDTDPVVADSVRCCLDDKPAATS